jgi:hypothetical protein
VNARSTQNDENVRHTQGDLFLCPDCEEFGFPSTSSSKGGNRKGTGTKKLAQAGARCKAASQTPESNALPTPSQNLNKEFIKGACKVTNCSASDKSPVICCDTCHCVYHTECLGFDSQSLVPVMCVVNVIGWVCLTCRDIVRSRLETLQMKQSDLAGTVEQI